MDYRRITIGLWLCIALASGVVSAAQPTPDIAPGPELDLTIRTPQGFTGSPLLLTVRLRNPAAMQAARDAALRSQRDTPSPLTGGTEGGDLSKQATPPEEDTEIQPLRLLGDWREHVTFTLAGPQEIAPVEPVLLSSTESAPAEAGILPLMTTWAIAPEMTGIMPAGNYTITAQLDPEGLFLEPDRFPGDRLTDSETFALNAPGGALEQAAMKETLAMYYVAMGECDVALAYALDAIRLDPQRYPAYGYAAQCQLMLGDRQQAIRTLETLLETVSPMQDGGEFYAAAQAWLEELKTSGDEP